MMKNIDTPRSYLVFACYSAFILAGLTILTFSLAMKAVPPSGQYCIENCMEYPFPDILLYYPRDYHWMYAAIFQLFSFLIFMVINHYLVEPGKKLFTSLAIAFSLISTTILLLAYFTQFAIVPISAAKGETEGIALLTQYNEHGLFIAMEELGYISMSFALLFLGIAFSGKTKLEKSIRIILLSQFVINVLAFIYFLTKYGIDRGYSFEIATISINWLALIAIGILSGIHLKNSL